MSKCCQNSTKIAECLVIPVEPRRHLVLDPCVHPKLLGLGFLECLLRSFRRAALCVQICCPDMKHVSLSVFNWNYLKMLLWMKSCVPATICVNLRSCHVSFLLAAFQLCPQGSPSKKGELKGGRVHLCNLGGTVLKLPLKRQCEVQGWFS